MDDNKNIPKLSLFKILPVLIPLFLLTVVFISSNFNKKSKDIRSKAAETTMTQRLIISNNTNQSSQNSTGQINNVKSYGAKGDGSTNDTAAIQSAVKASGSHSTIFFPPGVYVLSDGITISNNNVEIYGSGATITQTSWQSTIGSSLNVDSIYIHDLSINITANKGGPTIYMTGSPTNIIIERVNINNSRHNGIAIGSPAGSSTADNIIIRNSRITNPGDAGIQLAGKRVLVEGNYISGSPYNGIDSNAFDTTIKNNYLIGNGTSTSDIDLTARNGIYVGAQVSNVIIEGNTSINNGNATRPGDGINTTITNVQRAIINGNIVTGNTRNGIETSGKRFVITNNIVQKNNTPGKVDYGIRSDGPYSIISNNILDENFNRGISVTGSFTRVENNTITNSLIGIEVGGSPMTISIANNTITKNGTAGHQGIYIDTATANETQIYHNVIKGFVNDILDKGVNTVKSLQ